MIIGYILTAFVCIPLILSVIPSTKGWWGELMVRCVLSSLPKKDYYVIYDLRLRDGRKTSQTDHLVISRYGIFVIETKNWLGITSGNISDYMWNRSVLGKHYRTKSPVAQNQWHIDFLTNHFSDIAANRSHIHNVVVFAPGAILRIFGKRENCMMIWQLRKYITGFQSPVIAPDVINRIIKAITGNQNKKPYSKSSPAFQSYPLS